MAANAAMGITDPVPTVAELEADKSAKGPDHYRGRCGRPECRKPVSASFPEGACIHKGGPWHPACRAADRAAATLC